MSEVHIPRDVSRLGPLERAIHTKDADLWFETAKQRCEINPEDSSSCWEWTGAKRPNGYGFSGRLRTNRLVHRVSAWASTGFAGDFADLPHVHHLCGTRACINPSHLVLATALSNTLEASARNALLKRINLLSRALFELAPDHPLLATDVTSPAAMTIAVPRPGVLSETARYRAKRAIKKQAWEDSLRENERVRFEQVLEVERLMARRGMRRPEALQEVGMSRRSFEEYRARLRERVAAQEK